MKNAKGAAPPEGFRYQADVLPADEEAELVEQIRELPLKEFEFHGYVGKRRVVSYGWHYDFAERRLHRVDELPGFLLPLRDRAAAFAEVAPEELSHALVTEYVGEPPPGPLYPVLSLLVSLVVMAIFISIFRLIMLLISWVTVRTERQVLRKVTARVLATVGTVLMLAACGPRSSEGGATIDTEKLSARIGKIAADAAPARLGIGFIDLQDAEAWTLAASNLDEAVHRYGVVLMPAGGTVLGRLAAIGGDVLKFVASVVIAGFLFRPGPWLAAGARLIGGCCRVGPAEITAIAAVVNDDHLQRAHRGLENVESLAQ